MTLMQGFQRLCVQAGTPARPGHSPFVDSVLTFLSGFDWNWLVYFATGAMLVFAGLLLGAMFVMAFPVIVIAMVFGAIVKGVTSAVTSAFQERANLMSMEWQPTAAYLSGKKNGASNEAKDEDLKKLDDEVQARKQKE